LLLLRLSKLRRQWGLSPLLLRLQWLSLRNLLLWLSPLLLSPLLLLRLLHPIVLLKYLLLLKGSSLLSASFAIIANVSPDVQRHEDHQRDDNDHFETSENWG
jgi:hypothetical protein